MFEDLFRQFWWLLFPISAFMFGAWRNWLSYRANRETLDLMKAYAAAGRDPPPELLSKLERRWPDEAPHDERPRHRRRREQTWYQVVLFGLLSAGFAFSAATDLYGEGEAFTVVAFVLGAICAATLVQVLMDRGGPTV